MKTSEFVKEVEKLGFYVSSGYKINGIIGVAVNSFMRPFLGVDLESFGDITVKSENYQGSDVVTQGKVKQMINSGVELAFTPINKREDEPKFYVHLFTGGNGWLNWNDEVGELGVNTREDFEHWHSQFTEEQYNQFQNKQEASGHYTLPDYDPNNTDVFVPVEADK